MSKITNMMTLIEFPEYAVAFFEEVFSKIESDMVNFEIGSIGANEICKARYDSFILRFTPELQLIIETP